MSSEEPAGEGSYIDDGPNRCIPAVVHGNESIDMEVGNLTDTCVSSFEVAKLQTIPRLSQFPHPQITPAPTNINLPDLPAKRSTSVSDPATRN